VLLTLIRHGPTEWNATHRFQGRTDLSLSACGLRHAAAIAAALREERIDALYSSDLARAMETAAAIAEAHAIAMVPDARLREFDFGAWEGLTWDEVVAANPHFGGRGSTAAKLYAPQDGESFAQVCRRVEAFVDQARVRHSGGRIAVVTHAGPLHAALSVLGLDHVEASRDNLSLRFTPGGITRIALERDGARILELDSIGHLKAEG
jgi:2,3-bisphosphoglycerate-dependent phosphoglycerate mutase